MQINIININEISIFCFFYKRRGKKYYYTGINPHIIILKPILSKIVSFLENNNSIHNIEKLRDEYHLAGGDKASLIENQNYNSIKSSLISMYDLDTNKMQYGDYSYAYFHLTELYLFKIVQDIKAFEDISNVYDIQNLCGFNYEYKIVSEQLKSKFTSKFTLFKSKMIILIKLINTISVFFRSVIYITSRTRINVEKQKFALAVDMTIGQKEDDAHTYITKHIIESPKDILFVFRNKSELEAAKDQFKSFHKCIISDGKIYFKKIPRLLYLMLKDLHFLFKNYKEYSVDHFNRIINLIYLRIRLQIFFELYDTKCYWGRDDYNTSHTLRTLELRNRGNISIGIQHGLIIINPRPSKTYIDFDLYYVFGEYIKKYYLNTWSKKMKVKAIGCWGAGSEYFKLNKIKDRPKNIIYYQNMTYLDDIILPEIIKIAKHFSDRTIIFKPKYNGKRKELFDNYINKHDNLPSNIKINYGNSYQVMADASYSITLFSTVGAECLQFDLIPFWLDIEKDIKTHYYRNFPGLCVKNGDEIIQRINSIEDGSYKFEKNMYVDLINFKEKNIFNTVKNDINNFINRNI